MNLKDKIIVITGATKGLGRALAQAAKIAGAQVVISAREKREVKAVAQELGVEGMAADVSQEKDLQKLAEAVVKKFGRMDVWINNAGIWFPWADVEKTEVNNLRKMIEVNLYGTIYGCRQAALQMKKQGSGMIINIVSTTGLNGRPGSSGYAASKSGIIGFSKSIRKELAPSGIRVISIYPGGMKTDIFGENKIPGYENFLEPSDVAKAILKNLQKENPEEELVLEHQKDLEKV